MTKLYNFFIRRSHSLSRVLFLATFLSISLASFSQSQVLKGKILDERTKEPIIGVSVKIKGTNNAILTDVNGEYQLTTTQALPVTLAVSFFGYRYQEIDVYENEPLSVSLAEDVNKLDQVVVVGYGTKKREEFTGSIASIQVSSLKTTPVSSFDNALQGKAAGVQVTQSSGQPGASVSVRIRGGNSITGGNEPLYVIDGFPVYNDNSSVDAGALGGSGASAGSTNATNVNPLASINPSDIESIDILKDAASTAIYGSRGANGVVQITTKRGKTGPPQITYETYYGTQQIGKKLSLLNAQQFGQLRNDAIQTSNDVKKLTGATNFADPAYTPAQIDSLGNVKTNWQDAAFRIAPIKNHQLSIVGGDDKTRYALSGNYYKQDGILSNTDFERYSTRLNLERKLTDKLRVAENFTVSQINSNQAADDLVRNILAVRPDFPIYNADGSFTYKQPGEAAIGNPIASLVKQKNSSQTFRLLGNAFAEYTIVENLTAKVSFGVDRSTNNQFRYIPSTLSEGNNLGYANRGTKTSNTWLNENTLNYTKKVDDHAFEALAGFTQQQNNTTNFVAYASGFSNDVLKDNDMGSGTTLVVPSSIENSWALKSYLGRFGYGYKERYFFAVTARADGSSRFGDNNKWGYFPSASAAWTVSKEDFLKDNRVISNAKLRISAGKTGNQEIGTYQSLANESYYSYILGDKLVSGYAPARIANKDLTWEKTTQYDGGFDVGFFKNRITLTFDAYYKNTSDLLLGVTIPATSGQTSALLNYGTVENKGIEIALNTENIKTEFTWNSGISLSLNRNKILSLGDGVDYINNYTTDGTYINKVGSPVGSYYVYLTDGVFQATDNINNAPTNKSPSLPGYQKYVDVNKDGKIGLANDRVIVGSAQPKFIFGFTNNFSYKIFDLSLLIQGSYGSKIYNYNANYLNLGTGYTNTTTDKLNRWTPTNTNTTEQRAVQDPAPLASDKYIEDGSYIRLKSISFGVSLPKKWINKFKINNLRVYVSGQNLVTWTKYTGLDPEGTRSVQTSTSAAGANNVVQGYDNAVYPASKTYLAGLSITF